MVVEDWVIEVVFPQIRKIGVYIPVKQSNSELEIPSKAIRDCLYKVVEQGYDLILKLDLDAAHFRAWGYYGHLFCDAAF